MADDSPASLVPASDGKGYKLPGDERRCTAMGKDGERCKAYRGKDSELCTGHGAGFGRGGADPREAQRKGAEARRAPAEARKRTAQAVFRDAAAEHAALFVDTRLAIIRDELAPASARLQAMRDIEDRALGKPKEQVELTSRDEAMESIARKLEGWSPEERREALRLANLRRAASQ